MYQDTLKDHGNTTGPHTYFVSIALESMIIFACFKDCFSVRHEINFTINLVLKGYDQSPYFSIYEHGSLGEVSWKPLLTPEPLPPLGGILTKFTGKSFIHTARIHDLAALWRRKKCIN